MAEGRCACCGQKFTLNSRHPNQRFCSQVACQRDRKRRWQLAKRQTDPDYGENQARAHQAWARRNPQYWKEYRSNHPEYVQMNRSAQRQRNNKFKVANVDASLLGSGIYKLIGPLHTNDNNLIECTVRIEILSYELAQHGIAKRVPDKL